MEDRRPSNNHMFPNPSKWPAINLPELPLSEALTCGKNSSVKTEPFDFLTKDVHPLQVARLLHKALIREGGLGLAATQLGLPYRALIFGDVAFDNVAVMFNPVITWKSATLVRLEETCLSFPGWKVSIKRPDAVRVRFVDPMGNHHATRIEGLTARIVQHEMDHLDGVLFINRADRIHRERAERQFKRR
jgi:peptide deformylase